MNSDRTLASTEGWNFRLYGLPLVLGLPFLSTLFLNYWTSPDSNETWLVLFLIIWLLRHRRMEISFEAATDTPNTRKRLLAVAWCMLGPLYVVGRSQSLATVEGLALISLLAAHIYHFGGTILLKSVIGELLLLIFIVPAPASLIQTLTSPLKLAVSTSAAFLVGALGYPVAKSGVLLYVGQYQLFVADACSGLTSIFTLEALGLVYVRLQGYKNRLHNLLLACLILPISFAANTLRVITLILVTYHFGDAAGQGFLHTFAGLTLFLIGLFLMLTVDRLLLKITNPTWRGSR